MSLTKLGRRVLGNLPAWAADEQAVIEAEGGPEESIRSHSVPELTSLLADNPAAHEERLRLDGERGALDASEIEAALNALAGEGYCAVHEDGQWKMTEAGFDVLRAEEGPASEPRGAVVLGLHPAQATLAGSDPAGAAQAETAGAAQ